MPFWYYLYFTFLNFRNKELNTFIPGSAMILLHVMNLESLRTETQLSVYTRKTNEQPSWTKITYLNTAVPGGISKHGMNFLKLSSALALCQISTAVFLRETFLNQRFSNNTNLFFVSHKLQLSRDFPLPLPLAFPFHIFGGGHAVYVSRLCFPAKHAHLLTRQLSCCWWHQTLCRGWDSWPIRLKWNKRRSM